MLTVTEPATSPTVTGIRVVDPALMTLPSTVIEGTTPLAIISGTGFLPEAGVLPSVTIESLTVPGLASSATVLSMIDENPSPTIVQPALLIRLPQSAGGVLTPPATNSGQARVRVTYGNNLYPLNPSAGTASTSPPHLPADSRFLLYQSTLSPMMGAVSPRGIEVSAPTVCLPLQITGSGFLLGAQITLGGILLPESSYSVLSTTLIQVNQIPPALPPGLHQIRITNVDQQISPSVGGPALLAAFSLNLLSVQINATNTPTLSEGTTGITVILDGVCQQVTTLVNGNLESVSSLDPALGQTLLQLGSVLGGNVVNLPVPILPTVTIPSPGQFRIQAAIPPFPPGLANLPTGTQAGLTNTGLKHWQIIPAFCLNPGQLTHRDPTPASTEPQNRINYLASV
jgi:hypothetical protein